MSQRSLPFKLTLLTSLTLAALSAQADSKSTLYQLQSQSSKKVLDVAGNSTADNTPIHQYDNNAHTNQKFRIELVTDGSGDLRIVSALPGGKVIDVQSSSKADQALLVETTWANLPSQKWRFNSLDAANGVFEIVNRNSGKCLDVPGYSTLNSVTLNQYTCNKQTNQSWIIKNGNSIAFTLPMGIKSESSQKMIDVNPADGMVKQWTALDASAPNSSNQQWRFIPA